MGSPNNNFYMTSKAEMANKFSDIPETLYNLQEIHDKVENFP